MSTENEKNKWRYINAITFDKTDYSDDPDLASDYNPWIINKLLSYNFDTLEVAYFMDQHQELPKKVQFQFLLNNVRKAKRYTKTFRRLENVKKEDDLGIVQEYFQYSPA